MSYYQVLLVLSFALTFGGSQAKIEVVTDPSPVVVNAGEKVNLKCLLKLEKEPVNLKDLTVQWFHRGKQVAEYDNVLTLDKPGVSLSLESLKKGDATLTISNVTHEHEGNYRCYIDYKSEYKRNTIEVQVHDKNKPKEDLLLTSEDKHLNEQLKKILDWFEQFNGKLDVLATELKKCVPKP
ncbi:natural cytotoxicity triggering receptor 3 ligand 1 [Bombina bombina]|uniref:natural cytotoxicity triggering receptor 3 ligand 1 n=1 Tax=Bombina bombina TaxID=8345 RepID=UPI00235AF009|nr:natural cytotoxicity triggering receptor 3 ligand 1 [Bombina bombina]